ncbi:MAG TPA: hypothetical protein VFN28_11475 [Amaricoccus sp.]|nr:hypothetical protein [Amaricoccus sp.]
MSFRVMTCADADYFHFLPYLEANIARKFGRLPLVYDLGLTPDQRASLKSEIVSIEVTDAYKASEPTRGFIMTTHKPACIADCLDRSGEGCLYVDADVLFVERLRRADLGDPDIAVTPRHPKERTPLHLENGTINAGVLYFSRTPGARALLDTWTAACAVGDRTDQKALSDLLADFAILESLGPETQGGLRLMKLDPRSFNDVRLKTGRILHFKRAGRDPHVTAKLDRYRRLEERMPRALAAWFRTRHALGI